MTETKPPVTILGPHKIGHWGLIILGIDSLPTNDQSNPFDETYEAKVVPICSNLT